MTELPSWLATVGALAAVVGTLGGLAGISAVLNARAVKRKTLSEAAKVEAEADKVEAEAAAQLTDVALRLVTPLGTELTALRAAHGVTQARVGQLESDQRTQHMLLVEHSVWDHLALARMKDAGVELPTIPPLFHKATQPATAPAATPASTEVTFTMHSTPGEPAT